jgi:hypothetical protein
MCVLVPALGLRVHVQEFGLRLDFLQASPLTRGATMGLRRLPSPTE